MYTISQRVCVHAATIDMVRIYLSIELPLWAFSPSTKLPQQVWLPLILFKGKKDALCLEARFAWFSEKLLACF